MKEVRPQNRKTIDMNRIIHFEIHAGNPERAVKFYQDVFGWEINEWVMPGVQMKEEDRYWLVTTGPKTESGINGGIVSRRGPAPVDGQGINAFVCTIGVANLDDSVGKVMKSGGSVLLPRMPVQGIGWWASCKDTEGNSFGMMQEDANAR
jgi:predicted enzyme related to lactoylglutathione lyase